MKVGPRPSLESSSLTSMTTGNSTSSSSIDRTASLNILSSTLKLCTIKEWSFSHFGIAEWLKWGGQWLNLRGKTLSICSHFQMKTRWRTCKCRFRATQSWRTIVPIILTRACLPIYKVPSNQHSSKSSSSRKTTKTSTFTKTHRWIIKKLQGQFLWFPSSVRATLGRNRNT